MTDHAPTEVPDQSNRTENQQKPLIEIDQNKEQILANIRAVTSATSKEIRDIRKDTHIATTKLLNRFVSTTKANEPIPADVLESLEKGKDVKTIQASINSSIRAADLELVEDGDNGFRVVSTKFKELPEIPSSLKAIHEELLALSDKSGSKNVKKLFKLTYGQFHGIPLETVISHFQNAVPKGKNPEEWVRKLIYNQSTPGLGTLLEKRPFKIHIRNGVVILGPKEDETVILSPKNPDPSPANPLTLALAEGYRPATVEDIQSLLSKTRKPRGKIGTTETFLAVFLKAAKEGKDIQKYTLKQKYVKLGEKSAFVLAISNLKTYLKSKEYTLINTLDSGNTYVIVKQSEAQPSQTKVNYNFLIGKTRATTIKGNSTAKTFLGIFRQAAAEGRVVTRQELKERYHEPKNKYDFPTRLSNFRSFLENNGYNLVETENPENIGESKDKNTLTIQPTPPTTESEPPVSPDTIEPQLRAEIATLREELTQGQTRNTELEQALAEAKTQITKLLSVKESFTSAKTELATTKDSLASTQAELESVQRELARTRELLQKALADLKTKRPETTAPKSAPAIPQTGHRINTPKELSTFLSTLAGKYLPTTEGIQTINLISLLRELEIVIETKPTNADIRELCVLFREIICIAIAITPSFVVNQAMVQTLQQFLTDRIAIDNLGKYLERKLVETTYRTNIARIFEAEKNRIWELASKQPPAPATSSSQERKQPVHPSASSSRQSPGTPTSSGTPISSGTPTSCGTPTSGGNPAPSRNIPLRPKGPIVYINPKAEIATLTDLKQTIQAIATIVLTSDGKPPTRDKLHDLQAQITVLRTRQSVIIIAKRRYEEMITAALRSTPEGKVIDERVISQLIYPTF